RQRGGGPQPPAEAYSPPWWLSRGRALGRVNSGEQQRRWFPGVVVPFPRLPSRLPDPGRFNDTFVLQPRENGPDPRLDAIGLCLDVGLGQALGPTPQQRQDGVARLTGVPLLLEHLLGRLEPCALLLDFGVAAHRHLPAAPAELVVEPPLAD